MIELAWLLGLGTTLLLCVVAGETEQPTNKSHDVTCGQIGTGWLLAVNEGTVAEPGGILFGPY